MASLDDQQAGRDADFYDDDRHDGRYAAGGDRSAWFPVEPSTSPDLSISSDRAADIARITAETNALIERAFGPNAPAMERAA